MTQERIHATELLPALFARRALVKRTVRHEMGVVMPPDRGRLGFLPSCNESAASIDRTDVPMPDRLRLPSTLEALYGLVPTLDNIRIVSVLRVPQRVAVLLLGELLLRRFR